MFRLPGLLLALVLCAADTPADPPVEATNVEYLKTAVGKELQVVGTVTKINAAGAITFVDFQGAKGFSVIIRKRDLGKIEDGIDGGLKALVGKKITISGKVTAFKNAPQIELTDAKQISVAGAGPKPVDPDVPPVKPGEKPAGALPPVLKPTDTAALKAAVGKEVIIQGTVFRIGATKAATIYYIEFKGVGKDGFKCAIKKKDKPALDAAFDGDLANALSDKVVRVSGTLAEFRGNVQLLVTDPAQVRLADAKSTPKPPIEPTTPEPKPKPEPVGAVIAVTDADAIKNALGKEVTIKATITRVSADKNDAILFINFQGVGRMGFSAVVKAKSRKGFEAAFGGDAKKSLTGKDVLLTGTVSEFKNDLQIIIEDAKQIKIAGDKAPE